MANLFARDRRESCGNYTKPTAKHILAEIRPSVSGLQTYIEEYIYRSIRRKGSLPQFNGTPFALLFLIWNDWSPASLATYTGASAMTSNLRCVVRDASTIYGLTFVSGLGSAIAGFTMQNNPSTAYMVNLLSGAIGFTIAGMRIPRNRLEHIAWVAVTFWTFNLTNIAFGMQTYLAWIHSGITIVLMPILGGTLASILSPQSPTTLPYSSSAQIE